MLDALSAGPTVACRARGRPPACRGRRPTASPSPSRSTASCGRDDDGRFALGAPARRARPGGGGERSRSPSWPGPPSSGCGPRRGSRCSSTCATATGAGASPRSTRRTSCARSCPSAPLLPLDRGSAGRALSRRGRSSRVGRERRGAGARRRVGERSGPSAPDGAVVAAVSVSGPIGRTTRQPGTRYGAAVLTAAGRDRSRVSHLIVGLWPHDQVRKPARSATRRRRPRPRGWRRSAPRRRRCRRASAPIRASPSGEPGEITSSSSWRSSIEPIR